ncbi:MAG: outer membrane protein assembly factor BamB family protein [Armatimonadota bacterium]
MPNQTHLKHIRCIQISAFVIIFLLIVLLPIWAIPDFTFLHASDVHAPYAKSRPTIEEIASLGSINLTPYDIKSEPPSFVLVTGDLTEFGYGAGAWDTYLSYWRNVPIPIYSVSGNHDGTWDCVRNIIRDMYGSHSYSFDKFDCHFIGLDTATPQDPRPSITLEQIEWLKRDLKKTGKQTPIFIFLHHPLDSPEFASPYERDRLLDILRPYNVVIFLAGHTHSWQKLAIGGYDLTMGGSTALPEPGYCVASVKDGILRIAYKLVKQTSADLPVIEKVIPIKAADYPQIKIINPIEGKTYKTCFLNLSVTISNVFRTIRNVSYSIDDDLTGKLLLVEDRYSTNGDLKKMIPGAHYLRISFEDSSGKLYQRSTVFYIESDDVKTIWRSSGKGSFKGAPAVYGDTVYTGGTDGRLYAFNRLNGKLLWSYKTGGEILCRPAVNESGVYFGSGNCTMYAVDHKGIHKWSFKTKRPVYSSPVISGKSLVFGSNDPALYALDVDTGKLIWANNDSQYAIESMPFISNNTVYFGAWDKFLYAVDLKSGKTKWKNPTQGVVIRNGSAEKYYSPGDCGPVSIGTKVFVADRNSMLSVHDSADGHVIHSLNKCSAVGLSEDMNNIYLRRSGGEMTKIDANGTIIWSAKGVGADSLPVAPVESGGVVYTASQTGRLTALSSADGTLLWEYQVTPGLFMFSSVAVADGTVYATGMDGKLTAIRKQNN